ncbi:MAG: Fic family protein [Magnetococcales bacterium]|nr:Fic family protein [Magnetococcales bacterium]
MIKDHYTVVEGLFAFVKNAHPLSQHDIRSLHGAFTAHQDTIEAQTPDGRSVQIPLLKGEYKKQLNNPRRPDGRMHEYCPPEHVQTEMDHLVAWYGEWEAQKAPPEVLAAFLHHRFTQIHPFQDGNGRVARALATIVFLKAGLFPLVIRDAKRTPYIDALEQADAGDLRPLCDLFARLQREAILTALGIEQSVQQARHASEILASGLQLLKNKRDQEMVRRDEVFAHSVHLEGITSKRIQELDANLKSQLKESSPPGQNYASSFAYNENKTKKRDYFRHQILQIASGYKYLPDLSRHSASIVLTIRTINHFQWIVAFHGLGPVHKGIMAATSFTQFRIPREHGSGTDAVDVRPASPDFFQFNYAEPMSSIESRFSEWLDASLAMGLSEWQRSLARQLAG